jgi:hypothetical protein
MIMIRKLITGPESCEVVNPPPHGFPGSKTEETEIKLTSFLNYHIQKAASVIKLIYLKLKKQKFEIDRLKGLRHLRL